jgi:polyketide biosynthesis acyl carrier protein
MIAAATSILNEGGRIMTKNEVVGLLMKNLKAAVPGFKGKDIDAGTSYKELGVSSLDLVEVVSTTMHEMGVKVSPTALATVKTVDDLATLLVKAKGA